MVKTSHGKAGKAAAAPDRIVYLHGKEMVQETGTSPNSAYLEIGSQLQCTCDTYRTTLVNKIPWCAHVKIVYEQALDARDGHRPVDLPSFVEVVVFAAKPPTVATVGLDHENDIGLQRAWIAVHSLDGSTSFGQHFIGFLSKGAGRLVLRRMILDELTGMTLDQAVETPCVDSAHWKTGLFKKGFDPKDRLQLADILYRIQYNQCWTCFNNSSVPEV